MHIVSDNDQDERGEGLENGGGNGDQRREEGKQTQERNSGNWEPEDYPYHSTPLTFDSLKIT